MLNCSLNSLGMNTHTHTHWHRGLSYTTGLFIYLPKMAKMVALKNTMIRTNVFVSYLSSHACKNSKHSTPNVHEMQLHMHAHINTRRLALIHFSVCVCVCVCVWEKEREREKEREIYMKCNWKQYSHPPITTLTKWVVLQHSSTTQTNPLTNSTCFNIIFIQWNFFHCLKKKEQKMLNGLTSTIQVNHPQCVRRTLSKKEKQFSF